MKNKRFGPTVLNSPLWESLFQLVFISPANSLLFSIVFIFEKLIFITPALLYIFYHADWPNIFSFFNMINVFF